MGLLDLPEQPEERSLVIRALFMHSGPDNMSSFVEESVYNSGAF